MPAVFGIASVVAAIVQWRSELNAIRQGRHRTRATVAAAAGRGERAA